MIFRRTKNVILENVFNGCLLIPDAADVVVRSTQLPMLTMLLQLEAGDVRADIGTAQRTLLVLGVFTDRRLEG